MIRIKLTRGLFSTIDKRDLVVVASHKWCANKIGRIFYAVTNIRLASGKKSIATMHRMIMVPPKGLVVDHIDGNGLNNIRSNLRICTRGENASRQQPQVGRSSRFKGVSWYKSRQKWEAYSHFGGSKTNLGHFDKEEDAARAYNEAALSWLGDLAILNDLESENTLSPIRKGALCE